MERPNTVGTARDDRADDGLPPITLAAVESDEILKILPHRYPFLLIDRVIDIRGEHGGIGIKNITFNEPVFQGHFPERPIFPGVLLIEAMAQTAGVIGMLAMGVDRPRAVYFLTIDKCKFRKAVSPGQTVAFHLHKTGRKRAMWWYHGEAKVGDVTVAEADVGAMLAD